MNVWQWKRSRWSTSGCILIVAMACVFTEPLAVEAGEDDRPLVLAHYMPWYMAKPTSQVWGWHWTMNHFDPDKQVDGRREVASHYYPQIGPYDSSDPHVLEYQLLTMKLAGIDGVIVDWYGLTQFRDYPILHRSTEKLVEQVDRLGMKFVICYEDQTVPALVKAGRIAEADRVTHVVKEVQWLEKNWLKLKSYVRLDGKPVLLSFGQTGLTDAEWSACLGQTTNIMYFSEHNRRTKAVGAFDWPVPRQGLAALERFNKKASDWPQAIPVAYPRFVDVYKKAGLHDGYGKVDDLDGTTFRRSLDAALKTDSAIVQIATWNDWGEGTQIEPSVEIGYRDLEYVQRVRSAADKTFTYRPNDLRLPEDCLKLRRAGKSKLADRIARHLLLGELQQARKALEAR